MKRLLFTLVAACAVFFTASAQTTPGYAIFGPAPYGYTDLRNQVEVSTTITGCDNQMTATGYTQPDPATISFTGRGLGNTYTCYQNVAVSIRFKSNQTLALTRNQAIHVKIRRTDENSAGGLEFAFIRTYWGGGGEGGRLGWELQASSITTTLDDVVLTFGGTSSKGTWSTNGKGNFANEDNDTPKEVTFTGAINESDKYELFRINAANGESFEITQIYIDADANTPDPVDPNECTDEDDPTGLTLAASNIQDKSVTLTASANDAASSISYEFFYKAEGDAEFTSAGTASAAPNTDATKEVKGLAPETNYTFKVVATDPCNNEAEFVKPEEVQTLAFVERRYYFFRGDHASVSLPSEGVVSYDLRKDQTPGTTIVANNQLFNAKKYYSHFESSSTSWWSFNQNLKTNTDISEISNTGYLVIKFRSTYDADKIQIRLKGATSYLGTYLEETKGCAFDGTWNTVTLAIADAANHPIFGNSESGTIFQFYSGDGKQGTQGQYLDIAYAYLTNNAASVDDFADNVAPVISSMSDGDKTTSSVVLTVTASDDSGEALTYIIKESETVLASAPASGASGAETDITVSGLDGVNHTLTVIAQDGAGNEASQNIAVSLPAAVAPPSNLVVITTNTDKSVTFTMSADDDNASLVYAILDGSDNVLVDNIAGTAGVETVYTLHGLTPETAYSFKVRVTNAASLSTTSDAINITTDALSEHRFYLTRGNNTDPLPESSNLTSNYVDCNVEFGNAARDNRASDYISTKTGKDWIAITFKPKATVANEIDDNWYIVVRFRSNLSNNVFGFNNFRLNLDNNAQNWYINNDDADKPFGRNYNDGDWIVLKKKICDRRAGSAVPASYLQAGQIAAQLHVNANLIAGEFLDVDYVYFTDDITSIDEGTQHNAKIMLKDNADNSDVLAARDGQTLDVDITRSLTNASYNTFCVPFDLSAEQVEAIFGAGTTIGKLGNAHMKDGDELYLGFEFVDAIEAGVPYIIQPANEVANPLIAGVTINKEPNNTVVDGVITFKGVISPELINEQSAEDHSILLLAANNTLSWPNATANIKGMRAYFETTSTVAHVARRARFGFESEQTATGIDQISNDQSQITNKVVIDGQLIIIRDGVRYNVMGTKLQ